LSNYWFNNINRENDIIQNPGFEQNRDFFIYSAAPQRLQ